MEGIRFEDVGKPFPLDRGDDRPVTALHDGPDGMFPTGAAAEVPPDHENGCSPQCEVIEGKIRILQTMPIGVIDLGGAAGTYRLSANSSGPNPVRSIRFRYRAGMIRSVLTSVQSSRASRPRCVTNGCMLEIPDSKSRVCPGHRVLCTSVSFAPVAHHPHARSSRTSAKCPVTAAAAAIAGLTRWVRPPGPWRPSKFRLLVLAER